MKKIYKHKTTGYLAIQNVERTGYLVQYQELNGRTTVSAVFPNASIEQNPEMWEDVSFKGNSPSLN